MPNAKAFYCERRHQCKWQCFALHQGLGWGRIPDENNPWRVWHARECGGKLIELFEAPSHDPVQCDGEKR